MDMYSRYRAASVLRRLADEGEHGGFPNEFEAEEIGTAVARIMLNSPDPDWYKMFLRGFGDYAARG